MPLRQVIDAQYGNRSSGVILIKNASDPDQPQFAARGNFLRKAKARLTNSAMKLEHHIEARMTVPPEHDTYMQIHWDYVTWIEERLLDGLNLKYLGPMHPWVRKEILPRAQRLNIPVHMIAAISNPRSHPRTVEFHDDAIRLAYQGGLAGLNLYETWVYLRATPHDAIIPRGPTRTILQHLAAHQWLAGF